MFKRPSVKSLGSILEIHMGEVIIKGLFPGRMETGNSGFETTILQHRSTNPACSEI
jgi:hypothetical protein